MSLSKPYDTSIIIPKQSEISQRIKAEADINLKELIENHFSDLTASQRSTLSRYHNQIFISGAISGIELSRNTMFKK